MTELLQRKDGAYVNPRCLQCAHDYAHHVLFGAAIGSFKCRKVGDDGRCSCKGYVMKTKVRAQE